MTVAAYQYKSDDGTTYQLVLPTDFAAALNYIAATGTEPYLPDYISPRYATYRSPTTPLVATLIITAPFQVGVPPPVVQVTGSVYSLQSGYGEQRGAFLYPRAVPLVGPSGAAGATGPAGAAGPQGPPGTSGALLSVSGSLTASQFANLFTTGVQLVAAQGTGKIVFPVVWAWNLITGGTGMTGSGQVRLQLGSGAAFNLDSYAQYGSNYGIGQNVFQPSSIAASNENQALNLNASANATAGNASFTYNLQYAVYSL